MAFKNAVGLRVLLVQPDHVRLIWEVAVPLLRPDLPEAGCYKTFQLLSPGQIFAYLVIDYVGQSLSIY
jgi:hypothetical protein